MPNEQLEILAAMLAAVRSQLEDMLNTVQETGERIRILNESHEADLLEALDDDPQVDDFLNAMTAAHDKARLDEQPVNTPKLRATKCIFCATEIVCEETESGIYDIYCPNCRGADEPDTY